MQLCRKSIFILYCLVFLVSHATGIAAAASRSFAVLGPVIPASRISDNLYAYGLAATAAGPVNSMVLLSSSGQLYVQLLDGLGQRIGGATALTTSGFSYGGRITTLTGGRVAVVYDHTPGAIGAMAIHAAIFNPDGSLVATRLVSTIVTNSQRYPAVTPLSNGNFSVVWVDVPSTSAINRIRGRIVSPGGVLLGTEIAVSSPALRADTPDVAALGNGFAAAFVAGGKIMLRRFSLTGVAAGAAVQIDAADGRVHEKPKAAGLPGGGAAVLWESNVYAVITNLQVVVDTTLKGAILGGNGSVLNRFAIDDTGLTGGKIEKGSGLVAFGSGVLAGWSMTERTPDQFANSPVGQEARAVEVSTAGALGRFMTINAGSNLDQALGGLAVLANGKPLVIYGDLGRYPYADPLGLFATFLVPPNTNPTPIVGSPAADTNLRGTARNDTIRGLGGDDRLFGLNGNDTLEGGEGNDRLDGGIGRDLMLGGPGDDSYIVDDPLDRIVELANQGTDSARASVSFKLPPYVETLVLSGARAASGAGNAQANVVTGNEINNNLFGDAGNDTLHGDLGNDYLNGGVGADTLVGGPGSDTYVVDNAGDVIVEAVGGGSETVYTTVSFTLAAEAETLYLMGTTPINGTGNDGTNYIYGNGSANTLRGLSGTDQLFGGLGDDTIDGGPGSDFLYDGGGTDILTGGGGQDYFIFRPLFGQDTITDFTLPEADRIEVPQSLFTTPSDVLAAATQQGPHTVITAPSGDTITLQNVNVNDLTSDNFSVNNSY